MSRFQESAAEPPLASLTSHCRYRIAAAAAIIEIQESHALAEPITPRVPHKRSR